MNALYSIDSQISSKNKFNKFFPKQEFGKENPSIFTTV